MKNHKCHKNFFLFTRVILLSPGVKINSIQIVPVKKKHVFKFHPGLLTMPINR